jgi:hypothetical protein
VSSKSAPRSRTAGALVSANLKDFLFKLKYDQQLFYQNPQFTDASCY